LSALWSSNDSEGLPLDKLYGVEDIEPTMLAKMTEDCRRFQEKNADDIAAWVGSDCTPEEMAGHDFWLTRNGHGAGFWDNNWEEEVGQRLTEASEAFCEVYGFEDSFYHKDSTC
jgi:hypothetical protein